ncbi:MAG TPA: hypothetical protein VFW91_03065, partial [Candidatus Binatia bacterium]|nr:hypothetical protein [Candidatus Binatia bacterium]
KSHQGKMGYGRANLLRVDLIPIESASKGQEFERSKRSFHGPPFLSDLRRCQHAWDFSPSNRGWLFEGQYFTHKINMLWAIFCFTFGDFSGNIFISQKPG